MKRILRGASSISNASLSTYRNRRLLHQRLHPLQTIRPLSQLSHHEGLVEVKRVIVTPRRFTWKRLITYSLGASITFAIGDFLLDFVLQDVEEDEEEEEEEEEEEGGTDISLVTERIKASSKGDAVGSEGTGAAGIGGDPQSSTGSLGQHEKEALKRRVHDPNGYVPDEIPHDAWFIPLGRAKKLPRTLYGRDDPEWKGLVKFQKDADRSARVVKALTDATISLVERDPQLRNIFGGKVLLRRQWADMVYPKGPPQAFEQLGIEWGPDYIAVLHRNRDSLNVQRVQRALWPDTVTASAVHTFTDLLRAQYNNAWKSFGSSSEARVYPLSLTTPISLQASPAQSGSLLPVAASKRDVDGQDFQTNDAPNELPGILSFLPPIPRSDGNIAHGISLFKRRLHRSWQPPPNSSPGSIEVRLRLEIVGADASCQFHVQTLYSVMDDTITDLKIALLSVTPRIQRPQR